MENKHKNTGHKPPPPKTPDNSSKQGNDKAPGEDTPVKGKLTEADLKGKKVDRDISDANDEPIRPLPEE